MPNNIFKKLITSLVVGLAVLPTASAEASLNPAEEMIDNLARAESVNFSADFDFETNNDQLQAPVKMHLDLDGQTDFDNNSAFDLYFWTTDQFGKFDETRGSIKVKSDTIYLSQDDGTWYFVKTNTTNSSNADDLEETTTEMASFMQDMFARDIIEYEAETIAVVNKQMTMRYAYHINNERLVDYLTDEKIITQDEAEQVRASLADTVTVSGHLWVNTATMLPVMFTLNMKVIPDNDSYTTFKISVLFNSFNQLVDVKAPKNAVSLNDYAGNESDEIVSGLENSVLMMDTDGDGLTDQEEMSTWDTSPLNTDSDADGYADRTEVINGYDPNGYGKLDSDKDGLTDYKEMTVHWTNRFDSDSDNDGYNDGLEVANGYDPNGPGRWK